MKKGRYTLSKAERISASKDFSRVFKEGTRIGFPEFTIVAAANRRPYSRMGVGVGRRFGNAVKRNRAKRLCRELFRLHKPALPKGFDIVFLPRRQILHARWHVLQGRMNKAGRIIEKRFVTKSGKKNKSGDGGSHLDRKDL